MAYALTRPDRLSLDAFATAADLHPQLVHRLVALGLLDPDIDVTGRLWFRPAQLATVAQIRRLHAGLALNYAAIGVVMDLLARIARLEAALRAARRAPGSSERGRRRPGAGPDPTDPADRGRRRPGAGPRSDDSTDRRGSTWT